MNIVLKYLKYLGLFISFTLLITIFSSFLQIMGASLAFIKKLEIILTSISFFLISTYASGKTPEKGYIIGLKLGLVFIVLFIIFNILFFHNSFNIQRIIYYIILMISSILGGSFGKNFKLKKFAR